MERKNFLQKTVGIFGATAFFVQACKKEATGGGTSTTTETDGCITTPTEEEGPFPYTTDGTTKTEISNPLDRADVRSNSADGIVQTGVPFTFTIKLVNSNAGCAAISGARIDMWHCNKDGWYSGYANQNGGLSGTGNSYPGKDWLRGYQLTDSDGDITITTIYPGWYQGRATHIHFEIFIDGVLKKTTQLAFPESISDAVHVSSLYAAHGVNNTRNASDSVFGNSATDLANETFTITGDVNSGYTGSHTIGISL